MAPVDEEKKDNDGVYTAVWSEVRTSKMDTGATLRKSKSYSQQPKQNTMINNQPSFPPSPSYSLMNNIKDEEMQQLQLEKSDKITTSKRSRRHLSFDTVRGIAIFVMITTHTVGDTLDVDRYVQNLESGPLINVLALIFLSVAGGMAGIFLMCSAATNASSMRRALVRSTPLSILKKQVMGGFLVLFSAMFCEAFLGNHGVLGELARHLNRISDAPMDRWRYHGYHMETMHTVAWCVILNGIVHYILTKRYDIQTESNTVKRMYWYLVGLVLFATPFVWQIVSWAIPGYPWAINPTTGHALYLPKIGSSPWYDFVIYFFVNPLAAPVEPVFPYLAISFLGSILGLHVSDPTKYLDRSLPRRYFIAGFAALLAGLAGLVYVLSKSEKLYFDLYDHRAWTAERGLPGGWFWQFLAVNGFSLMAICGAIRQELRGDHIVIFERNAKFWRRLGNNSLTIYIFQWVYIPVSLLVGSLTGYQPYERFLWPSTLLTLLLTFLAIKYTLVGWAKIGFLGSLEWALNTVAKKILSKRPDDKEKKWWQVGLIHLDGTLENVDWFKEDSSVADTERLFIWGECMGFLVAPVSVLVVLQSLQLSRMHPDQDFSKHFWRGLAGIIFFMLWFPFLFFFSLNDIRESLGT